MSSPHSWSEVEKGKSNSDKKQHHQQQQHKPRRSPKKKRSSKGKPTSKKVFFHSNYVKILIGKRGTIVKSIKSQSGANVNIKDDKGTGMATLSGTPEQVGDCYSLRATCLLIVFGFSVFKSFRIPQMGVLRRV